MALTIEKTFDDGFVATYHRINDLKMRGDGGPCSFILESYASEVDRGVPGARCKRTEFDFMPKGGGSPFAQAYSALALHPDWVNAVPDDAPTPGAVKAVESGSMKWDGESGNWVPAKPQKSIEELRSDAFQLIDSSAGKARLRYITSIPGQAETYQRKEQQARDWAATDFAGDPPSFIAAEASALEVSPTTVANDVIATADFWVNTKGPQIEACRRKWKVRVEAETDPSQIDNLVEQATTEMDTL